jgi:hypothetical protein
MKSVNWILAGLLAIGVVAGIAFGAYRAGERHADDDDRIVRIESPTGSQDVEVVQIEDRDWGFFPGFFFLPLFFILLFFLLARGVFGGWRGGPWAWGRVAPEEWHRRQHESDAARTPDDGPPAPSAS